MSFLGGKTMDMQYQLVDVLLTHRQDSYPAQRIVYLLRGDGTLEIVYGQDIFRNPNYRFKEWKPNAPAKERIGEYVGNRGTFELKKTYGVFTPSHQIVATAQFRLLEGKNPFYSRLKQMYNVQELRQIAGKVETASIVAGDTKVPFVPLVSLPKALKNLMVAPPENLTEVKVTIRFNDGSIMSTSVAELGKQFKPLKGKSEIGSVSRQWREVVITIGERNIRLFRHNNLRWNKVFKLVID